jgi:hypothetical protein
MGVPAISRQHPLFKLCARADLPRVFQDEVAARDGLARAHPPPLLLGHEALEAWRVLAPLDALVAAPLLVHAQLGLTLRKRRPVNDMHG